MHKVADVTVAKNIMDAIRTRKDLIREISFAWTL